MLDLFRSTRQRPMAHSHSSGRITITEDASKFKHANPRWLVEGASWTPDTLPEQLNVPPPQLASFKAAVDSGEFVLPELGSQACKDLFCLEAGFTYLNHGSYGAAYRLALDVQAWYRQQLEQEPVRFMETQGLAALVSAVADVAGFVGAEWKDVVPVTNATSGVNAVLHSLQFKKGDLILVTNATYAAVRNTVGSVAAAAGAGILDIHLELTDLQEEERLVSVFQEALRLGGSRLRLAVVDFIFSFPPIILPVRRLCKMFSAAGVPVLVDGAHAVGSLHALRVPDLGCTYFVATLHKWLCTPKGAAMLWVHPSVQHTIHPCVVSHGCGLGYRAEFLWQGTADFSAWLAASACLMMQRAFGTQKITSYNHNLIKQAADMLLQAWGTQMALGISADGATAGLVAVQLPWPLNVSSRTGGSCSPHPAPGEAQVTYCHGGFGSRSEAPAVVAPPNPADAALLNLLLREQHRIEVPIVCVSELLFARISAQIYNSTSDYERLRDVILQLRQCR